MTTFAMGNCSHASAQHGDIYCPDCGASVAPPPNPGMRPPPSAPPSDPPASTETFASEGQVRQNQTYIGNRLMFSRGGEVEASFANVVSGSVIWDHLKRLIIGEVILWVLFNLIAVVLIVVSSSLSTATSDYPYGGLGGLGSSIAAKFVIAGLIYTILALGLLVVSFIGWIQQPMSEWELLLDRRAVSQDSAFAAITIALRQRRIPASVGPQRILLDGPSRTYGSYLVVASDPYFVYISVLPYGDGLYLGWSMWREQRIFRLYREWFRQLRTRWAGGGSMVSFLLQAEEARALRETVHNAVRDGVETAITQKSVSLTDAFGAQVPPVKSGTFRGGGSRAHAVQAPYYGPPPQYGPQQ